jgi:hypothetical protein
VDLDHVRRRYRIAQQVFEGAIRAGNLAQRRPLAGGSLAVKQPGLWQMNRLPPG